MGNAVQGSLLAREVGLLLVGILVSVLLIAVDYRQADTVIAAIGTVQLAAYLFTTFKRVFQHISHEDMSVDKCLFSLALMTSFFVFAFGINYCLLTLADADALKNFSPPTLALRLLDSWYFSTVVFTATGFGEYVPATYAGKALVWGEMVLGFATTVFAVSSFISFSNKD